MLNFCRVISVLPLMRTVYVLSHLESYLSGDKENIDECTIVPTPPHGDLKEGMGLLPGPEYYFDRFGERTMAGLQTFLSGL